MHETDYFIVAYKLLKEGGCTIQEAHDYAPDLADRLEATTAQFIVEQFSGWTADNERKENQ